jgi:hypothetical protein
MRLCRRRARAASQLVLPAGNKLPPITRYGKTPGQTIGNRDSDDDRAAESGHSPYVAKTAIGRGLSFASFLRFGLHAPLSRLEIPTRRRGNRILIRASGVIFSAPTGRRHVRTRNDRNASGDPLTRGAVQPLLK